MLWDSQTLYSHCVLSSRSYNPCSVSDPIELRIPFDLLMMRDTEGSLASPTESVDALVMGAHLWPALADAQQPRPKNIPALAPPLKTIPTSIPTPLRSFILLSGSTPKNYKKLSSTFCSISC